MIKLCAAVALTAMTALMGSLAWAAREEHTFEVSVSIPTRSFYLIPAEPDWIHRPQRLNWNPSTSTLSSVRKNFDVRHDTSAIEARLEAAPYLSNGRPADDIVLRVSFNGVELSPDLSPRLVVSAADAAAGKRVLLEVAPVMPSGGYRPGDYSGNVLLLFSARAPGE
ncbi:CS1 type fimbrial major subunit [Pseudomonas fluorescens]|uniref:CS1 type fimbrial major subunit n=1 Tax=Pseudomonas fluorescens TaxID=294 RepID=A0A0F4V7A7_PSEFL|nr:CS1 type fimbrial major subunit [Pseudomonas fluorescens]KJZ64733.1 CS1 type fimbrial major subunit [Pseudomonas fluorescens]